MIRTCDLCLRRAERNGPTGFAGFTLWRHEFIESQWWDLPVQPDWLWIKTQEGQLVVAAEFDRSRGSA